jgi:hypothetical protein
MTDCDDFDQRNKVGVRRFALGGLERGTGLRRSDGCQPILGGPRDRPGFVM